MPRKDGSDAFRRVRRFSLERREAVGAEGFLASLHQVEFRLVLTLDLLHEEHLDIVHLSIYIGEAVVSSSLRLLSRAWIQIVLLLVLDFPDPLSV